MKFFNAPRLNFLPDTKRAEGLLPYVIAVMIYLCAIAIFTGLSIQSGIEKWSGGLSSRMSVQITLTDKTQRDKQTVAVLDLLNATPGVKEAKIIADSEILEMISPWLGDISMIDDLPVPSLIDVEMVNPDSVNIPALRSRLKSTSPAATIDDHQGWLSDVLSLAMTVRAIALTLVIMVIVCTVAIVVFGCRAGLATHRDSVKLMHLMGAEDRAIAREFHHNFMIHGLKGGLWGTGLAFITLFALSNMVENIGEGLVTSFDPASWTYLILLGLPLFSMGLATMTASLTVRRALSELI